MSGPWSLEYWSLPVCWARLVSPSELAHLVDVYDSVSI